MAKPAESVRARGVVTREGALDRFGLHVEVRNRSAGQASWKPAFCEPVRELCRASVDSVSLVPPESLPVDGQTVIEGRMLE